MPSKGKPPSRVRYEAANPAVSCRVGKDLYRRLQAVRKAEGRSLADVLAIGLGVLEVKMKSEAELRQQGYEQAAQLFMVTFRCAGCGKSISVTGQAAKEACQRYLEREGWSHAECYPKRR